MADKTPKSQTEMPNETTITAIVAAEAGETTGPFDSVTELMKELNLPDKKDADFHIQCLGPDLILVLCGKEGMLDAADQYCDAHNSLELTEYLDWIGHHNLKARMCIAPGLKGIFYRHKLAKIVRTVNDRFRQLGAFVSEDDVSLEDVNRTLQNGKISTQE